MVVSTLRDEVARDHSERIAADKTSTVSIIFLAACFIFPTLLPVFATLATATVLSRQLPLQNILALTLIIAVIFSLDELLGVRTSSPAALWWVVPLYGLVAIINSRGVARLILRPWRNRNGYGIGVIVLASLLAIAFYASLDVLLALDGLASASAPASRFVGMTIAAFISLGLTVPWFIDKRRGEQPPDYFPLILWVSLVLLAAGFDASRQARWRSGFELAMALVVSFACRMSFAATSAKA